MFWPLAWCGVLGVADSAQFSAIVTELADQAYVGTAVALQLAPGPAMGALAMGALAMTRLMRSPEAARIAGGLG